jgi:hypothetical protein
MGACETHSANQHIPRGNHPAGLSVIPQIPEGSSTFPIIGRRLPASSSFVLAASGCGRSSWTPDRATAQTGSDEESHNNNHPSPAAQQPQVTGSDHRAS